MDYLASTGITSTTTRASAAPAPRRPGDIYGAAGSCAYLVTAGPHTSCPFAENVSLAYWKAQSAGASSTTTVTAFSEATGQSYSMSCAPQAGVQLVRCSGGNGGSVSFGPANEKATVGQLMPCPASEVPDANRRLVCPEAALFPQAVERRSPHART